MESITTIAVDQVRVVPGRNPRSHFDVSDLVPSLKASGGNDVPIIVQPLDEDGQYPLIDGERRYRASLEAGTPLRAIVRDVDDAEAVRIAFMASIGRRGLGPGEEASMAQRMLTATEGDRAEAAKRLGWSRTKLDARMLLLHVSPAVLAALNDRQIKLGHAELLSTLPASTQDGTVKAIIKQSISVADLKQRVASFALVLATAPFDTAGCQGCPHNTTEQADLFDTSIADGRCTDRECWTAKTEAFLDVTKAGLQDDVPAVWFDRDRAPDSYSTLSVRGPHGVGDVQITACKGCKHFGVLVLTAPGQAGKTVDGQCFDVACHAEKQAAYQAQIAPTTGASATSDSASTPGATPSGESATPPPPKKPSAKPPRPSNGTPRALQEHINGIWRTTATNTTTPALAQATVTYLALKGVGAKAQDIAKAVSPVLGAALSVGGSEAKALAILVTLDADQLAELHDRVTQAHLMSEVTGIAVVKTAIQVCDATLAEHFQVDKAFLDKHTKSGLEVLLRDAGFATWMDFTVTDKKKAGFKALMTKKKGDIITAVMLAQENGAFDFTGYVPPSVAITPKETASHA